MGGASGECWHLNLNREHRPANPTPERRIHLVVDCAVDPWLHNFPKMGAVAGPQVGIGSPR